jgi:polysaccharide pyruvyl transferase WcaK-like protein
MIRVLLVGDVAIDSRATPYHVGDEAALNEVSRRLSEQNTNIELSQDRQPIPAATFSLNAIKDLKSRSKLSQILLSEVDKCDIVWFVGSGNLNSQFRDYLYHRIALMLTAKALNKVVVVTSQTIGPFTDDDQKLFASSINNADYLSVRDNLDSVAEVKAYHADCIVTHDDASCLPYKKLAFGSDFQLGLSLRDWDSSVVMGTVKQIYGWVRGRGNTHLIPHLVDSTDGLDIGVMRKFFDGISYDYFYFERLGERIDRAVKSLTASMDLLIATRYHAAVFAATTGVKCIALYDGEYYRRKMRGLQSLGLRNLLVLDATKRVERRVVEEFIKTQESSVEISLPNTADIINAATQSHRFHS